jgi:hypothetical protein
MTVDQASAESDLFSIAPAGHQFAAYFIRSSATQFTPHFAVDNNSLASTPATVNQRMFLSTLESTIYLGHSPLSGDSFAGTMGPIRVDPVCTGTG